MAERAQQKKPASSGKRTKAHAPRKAATPPAPKLTPPPQAAVMQAAFDLSRQLSLEVREE